MRQFEAAKILLLNAASCKGKSSILRTQTRTQQQNQRLLTTEDMGETIKGLVASITVNFCPAFLCVPPCHLCLIRSSREWPANTRQPLHPGILHSILRISTKCNSRSATHDCRCGSVRSLCASR
jgi:hypothetical protein